jgi:hypothetical protein
VPTALGKPGRTSLQATRLVERFARIVAIRRPRFHSIVSQPEVARPASRTASMVLMRLRGQPENHRQPTKEPAHEPATAQSASKYSWVLSVASA